MGQKMWDWNQDGNVAHLVRKRMGGFRDGSKKDWGRLNWGHGWEQPAQLPREEWDQREAMETKYISYTGLPAARPPSSERERGRKKGT